MSSNLEFIQRIQMRYSYLSVAMQKIADFLLQAEIKTIKDFNNINLLAKETGTSPATITRFCKLLGYNGFAELKFYINKEILGAHSKAEVLKKNDSASEIKQKVAELTMQSISMTELKMDNEMLEKAVAAILNAETVAFFGMGATAGIAETAAGMMLCSGINSFSSTDPLTQMRRVSYMKKGDVIVGLNNQGESRDIYDVFLLAQQKGIVVVAVTTFPNSPLSLVADIHLGTAIENGEIMQLPMAMICQLFVVECLQVGVSMKNVALRKELVDEMFKFTATKNVQKSD